VIFDICPRLGAVNVTSRRGGRVNRCSIFFTIPSAVRPRGVTSTKSDTERRSES
jgi:hypothetical protein